MFGRVKGFRWGVKSDIGHPNPPKGFSRRVADSLNRDTEIMRRILSCDLIDEVYVSAEPGYGNWEIGDNLDTEETEWTRPLWDCYQAIAQSLLAMPMPTDE